MRIRFIKACLKYNLTPTHLNVYRRHTNISLFNKTSFNSLDRISNNFINIVLRLELRDAYKHLHFLRHQFYMTSRSVSNVLLPLIENNFFLFQEKRNGLLWKRECSRIDKKIDWLKQKKRQVLTERIGHIKYAAKTFNVSNKKTTFSFQHLTSKEDETIHNIHVSPLEFNLETPFDTLHNNWFTNLSNINIPNDVQYLLQLGDRFGLPMLEGNKNKTLLEFIKHIEHNISKYRNNIHVAIRNRSVSILECLFRSGRRVNINDQLIKDWLRATGRFVREHPDILFTRADKGNVTVALDKKDYIFKMENMLSDESTYVKVPNDPVLKLTKEARSLLSNWKEKGYIEQHVYRSMLTTDGVLPRAYGLPKIHKPNNPLRIIISSINSPLYSLAYFLHNIIYISTPEADSFIKNSFHLVDKLNGFPLESDHVLASLDVVSLFTNVPKDLAVESVTTRWELISQNTTIPFDEFLGALKLIIDSTFFKFNNICYKQIFGLPMGSPLSPILADLVMQDLECKAIKNLTFHLPLYYRYVDDIILAAPVNSLPSVLDTFNSMHDRLQFTIEIENENRISFLDVTLIKWNDRIIFDQYRKPTFSGRYLNFFSHHPLCHKKGVVFGMVDKLVLLSHPQFHRKNFICLINILLENNYPLNFIFAMISYRLKHLFYKNDTCVEDKHVRRYFTIPYIESVSDKFSSFSRRFDCSVAFTIPFKLNKFITTGKDHIERLSCNDVVYKINCKDCESSYVGQTKRQLKTRVSEHKADIRKASSPSVISQHRIGKNHEFDWENVEILDKEPSYKKRSISEMLHIKKQVLGLNKQSDTELLPDAYLPILDRMSPP